MDVQPSAQYENRITAPPRRSRQRLRGPYKEAQVIGVKAMIREGCDPRIIAELFNIKESTVERIYRQR